VLRTGEQKVEWHRWIAAAEPGRREIVFRPLPAVYVSGLGGGKMKDEELHTSIFAGGQSLFLPGSVVHTDSVGAYVNLASTAPTEDPPSWKDNLDRTGCVRRCRTCTVWKPNTRLMPGAWPTRKRTL
jgi:hypothetical protein